MAGNDPHGQAPSGPGASGRRLHHPTEAPCDDDDPGLRKALTGFFGKSGD
jgi:hypothetical protein